MAHAGLCSLTDLEAALGRRFSHAPKAAWNLSPDMESGKPASGGYIWVYSEVDQGTAFKIYLPRIEKALQPVVAQHPIGLPVVKGWETILLAEDSESVREMTSEYLQSIGYTVLTAASGQEALQRAKESNQTIHLLLADIVMPEVNGPELAEQVALLRPGIKVIFTSGYASETLAHRGSLDPLSRSFKSLIVLKPWPEEFAKFWMRL